MTTKMVKQYRCDFCGKKKYSAGHMKSHELHCTMNPNRECRMCNIMAGDGTVHHGLTVAQMVSILPDPKKYYKKICDEFGERDDWPGLEEDVAKAFPKLRDAVNNCPACIMAALRQAGIHISIARFGYADEVANFWSEHNEIDQREEIEASLHCR